MQHRYPLTWVFSRDRHRIAYAFALLIGCRPAFGQAAHQTAAPKPNSVAAPSSAAFAGRGGISEETIELSPFEVMADLDGSYGALNSNSIAAFNTALNSADIFDQSLMTDGGVSRGIEQLIETFSAGTGFATMTPDATAGTEQPRDRRNYGYMQLRGLVAPPMQRDGLMFVGAW